MNLKNKAGKCAGLTRLEVLVVILFVFLLLGWFGSILATAKATSGGVNCLNNLKQVGLSCRMWAQDNDGAYPMRYRTNNFDGPSYANSRQMFIYFQVMSNELSTPKVVICSDDGRKSAATNFGAEFSSAHVSYFAGLDAEEKSPNSILAGDSNLRNGPKSKIGMLDLSASQTLSWEKGRHEKYAYSDEVYGNVAMGDGSVQRFTAAALKQFLGTNGVATNRIVLPEDGK